MLSDWSSGYAIGISLGLAIGLIAGKSQKPWSKMSKKEKDSKVYLMIGLGLIVFILGIVAVYFVNK